MVRPSLFPMARRPVRRPVRAAKPKPKLPVTRRVVTTTERTQFGRVRGFGAVNVDEFLDRAFVAADDGRCAEVSEMLDEAEAAGGRVGLHRKQLMQDCKLDRSGIAGVGVGQQSDWLNWRTALLGVGALWLGAKIF